MLTQLVSCSSAAQHCAGATKNYRAGGPELGDFGLADFGVGGEQHHLMARLSLVVLVRTLTTGWIGLFSDWVGVLTRLRCAMEIALHQVMAVF